MIPGPFVVIRDGDRAYFVWPRPRTARPTSSLRAFYLWLLVAFAAGAIAGAAVAAAFSGAPWTEQHPSGASSALTSAVHGDPVRAGRMVQARAADDIGPSHGSERGVHVDDSTSSTDPARTTAIAELPASEPIRSVTTLGPTRDDPAAVLAAIDAAAAEFGHDPERMRVVTFCESRWDPLAVGDAGTSFGLWQFQLATWRANVRRAGFGYSDADVFDPVASSRVAAWMWANAGELLWTCAR